MSCLTEPQAMLLIAAMAQTAESAPVPVLTPESWEAEFGKGGKVATPIGEVKMGKNQYAKMLAKGRQAEFCMVKPTLTAPDVIIETPSKARIFLVDFLVCSEVR